MEWARKCISDGANVNYQTEVSYDVHVYHIERSIMNEMFFTCADLHTCMSRFSDVSKSWFYFCGVFNFH